MFQVDLHSHTRFSPDANTDPRALVERAREVGLDRIAITDHGTIEGALVARDADPELVIVGEEIRCRCRTELIGLFLRERVPQRLSLEETVERIRDQGGVVYAPHPYAYARQALRRARRALDVADAVEAVNARAFLRVWNRAAMRAAERRSLPAAAGSDAHFAFEIGRAYAAMPAFRTPAEFRAALDGARPVWRQASSPFLHVASLGLKAGRAVREWVGEEGRLAAPRPATAD